MISARLEAKKALDPPLSTSAETHTAESILSSDIPRIHQRLAAVTACLIVLAFCMLLPWARRSADALQPFMAVFSTTVLLTDSLTAYLLYIQFIMTRLPSLGLMAAAYAFTLPIIGIQLFAFPGLFASTALLMVPPDSLAWMWVVWHSVFPACALAMAISRLRTQKPLLKEALSRAVWWLILSPLVLSAFLGGSAIALPLPPLVSNVSRSYFPQAIGLAVVLLNGAALLLLCLKTRLRTLLHLWLAVVLLASFLDVVLTLVSDTRFSIGFYGARVLSLLSSALLLLVLLAEIYRVYGKLQRANRHLYRHAHRDALTGIYNRRYFTAQLAQERIRSQRKQQPVALILVDVDYFKHYNDHFGHLKGDAALQRVAHLLSKQIRRPADFVARYGGEEFAVVLPDTGLEGAQIVAESARLGILALEVAHPSRPDGLTYVTISLGIAVSAAQSAEEDAELIGRADKALYSAKAQGRNRYAVFKGSQERPASLNGDG